MIIWLYFLRSDTEYHNLIDFLKKFDEVYGVFHYIVDGALKMENETYFGNYDRVSIFLSFSTHFLDIDEELTEKDKLDSRSLIKLTDIHRSEVDKSLDRKCYLRKGMTFMSEKKLLHHLKEICFQFPDHSTLTKYKYILGY